MHTAAKANDLDALTEYFLQTESINVNAATVLGVTPLHVAVSRGGMAMVWQFVLRGADLNALDCQGFSPCHRAIRRGNVEMLKALLARGATANVADKQGETLVHQAVASGSKYLLLPLIAAGASLNEADLNGKRPIHVAVGDDKVAVLATLLVAGADANATDRNGQTTWTQAVVRGAQQTRVVLHAAGLGTQLEPLPNDTETAMRLLAAAQFDLVKRRAAEVCVGLHALELNALQLCEILKYACGDLQYEVPFHLWWNLAVAVKHFHQQTQK